MSHHNILLCNTRMKVPKHEIKLLNAELEKPTLDHPNPGFRFQILAGNKEWLFSVPSKEEQTTWLKQLKERIFHCELAEAIGFPHPQKKKGKRLSSNEKVKKSISRPGGSSKRDSYSFGKKIPLARSNEQKQQDQDLLALARDLSKCDDSDSDPMLAWMTEK